MPDSSSVPPPLRDLTGEVLVVTGASTGIGAATARLAVERGMRVVLAARRASPLEELATELGDAALAVPADVTDWDAQVALFERAAQEFGRVDVAFANAGFGAARGFEESTPKHWREMVLTNVYGAALTARAALPHLRPRNGHILVTSSTAGRRVLPGSLYSATKHAATAIGEALRQELAESQIRVTTISPGMTDTPFFDAGAPDWALRPEDVARAVIYALEQPAHVNIAEIVLRPTAQTL